MNKNSVTGVTSVTNITKCDCSSTKLLLPLSQVPQPFQSMMIINKTPVTGVTSVTTVATIPKHDYSSQTCHHIRHKRHKQQLRNNLAWVAATLAVAQ